MASLEGQMLGPYKIIAQMGSGGMATVYKAHHERLDRTVAIKMLHEAFREDRNFHARFQREAQIVARLEHPHIVPVYDFDEFNGRPYLVMKYIEGRTLKAELDDHALTLGEILTLLPPIAAALDYAHGQGVLHRDVKPSNIIIENTGVPYVTDFGLARMAQLGESTLSHDILLGTPHYISPEQAMGNRDLDSRTDLYSFGIVLYELVVGRVPFSADTPFAVIHDQIYRELPKPSSINPELKPEVDAVLQKALAKNPAERYATATEMVDAFRRAVEQTNLKGLNPERSSLASESLAKVRDEQNRQPQPPAASIPPPMPAKRTEAPVDEDDPNWWMEGASDVRHSPPPPRRPEMPPLPPSPEKPKRVVEASFDFSNVGDVLKSTDSALRGAFEQISAVFDPPKDLDLRPLDDEEAIRKRVEEQLNKRKEFSIHLMVFFPIIIIMWIIYGTGLPANFIGGLTNNTDIVNLFGFPWPLIVTLGWGAGLVAHGIETYYTTGRRANARLRAIHSELERVYGPDWRRTSQKELRKVRNRVNDEFNKRREWLQHLGVFVCINAMLWLIYLFSGGGFPWALIVTLGWGVGLVAHGIEYRSHSTRETAINRAIEQERDMIYGTEKPKRDRRSDASRADRGAGRVRLTEDGEFTDSMIEELEDDARARRDRR